MPTLLWGCILDGFMTSVPTDDQGACGYLLKLSVQDVVADASVCGGDTRRMLARLREQAMKSQGPFVDCVRQVGAQ